MFINRTTFLQDGFSVLSPSTKRLERRSDLLIGREQQLRYLCLHHVVPLLTYVREEAVDVERLLVSQLFHHAVDDDVGARSAHTGAGKDMSEQARVNQSISWLYEQFLDIDTVERLSSTCSERRAGRSRRVARPPSA